MGSDYQQALKSSFATGPELIGVSVAIASSAAETAIVAAPGAGMTNRITCIEVSNETATASVCTFRTSTGGAVIRKILIPASGTMTLNIPNGIRCADNGAFTAQLVSAVITVNFNVYGFKRLTND